MKILCVADHIDPLVYSIHAKERFADVDLVLGAGDIPMNYLGFIASILNRDIFFVFGNHDLTCFEMFRKPEQSSIYDFNDHGNTENKVRNYFGSTYIGDKVIKARHGLLIAGLGGCIRYNKGTNQYTECQMFFKMLTLIPRLIFNRIFHGRYLDILLTHSPPYKLNDQNTHTHRGFKTFRIFMRLFKPRYLIHGHVHLYDHNSDRVVHFHETQIINVYNHFVLEFPYEC